MSQISSAWLARVGLRRSAGSRDRRPGFARIDGFERVLGINEGADAPFFLGLGTVCSAIVVLPEAFRAIDLDDAPLGQGRRHTSAISRPSEPVEMGLDLHTCSISRRDDRALAEGTLDLGESAGPGHFDLLPIFPLTSRNFCCHSYITLGDLSEAGMDRVSQ